MSDVLEDMKAKADGCTATASGWIIEEVTSTQILGLEVKGRAFVACIGWQDRKRHMNFERTEQYQELLSLMKEEPVGLEMHHTTFQELGKDKKMNSVRERDGASNTV